MHININYHNAITNNNLIEKARDDVFIPETKPSIAYKVWISALSPTTCIDCADNHGRIIALNDPTSTKPPLHLRCKCRLVEAETIKAGGATHNKTDGADYWLKYYGKLPEYYISSEQLKELGWKKNERPSQYVSGKMLGGDVYKNKKRILPVKPGRVWYEADINYTPGRRNLHRVLWSNDGLIFVTYDHYHTFYEIV